MPDLHSIESSLAPLRWNKARVKLLAAVVVALLSAQSINLAKLALLMPTDAKVSSAYKRLQRFLADFAPDLDSFARLLSSLCRVAPPWNLALDRTNWKLGGAHLNLLMLCIVDEHISFPLLWMPLSRSGRGKAGNSNGAERTVLMERFIGLFGASACQCLRADREFASRHWLKWMEDNGIAYQLRIKGDVLVADSEGQMCCADWLFRDCPIQQERQLGFRKVLGKVRFVTGTRLADGNFLILVSDQERPLEQYSLRWGIECMFGAFKRRGFNLEDTHVTAPERLGRLMVFLALAYTWAGVCGLWKLAEPLFQWKVKAHGRHAISVFRIGLDYLRLIMLKLCRTISESQSANALRFLSCT